MIETKEQREAREKAEGKERAKRAAGYTRKMGGSRVAVSDVNSAQPGGKSKKRDRAAYFREYRKRPKKCPHCGKVI